MGLFSGLSRGGGGDGEVVFNITADNSKAVDAINDTVQEMKKAGSDMVATADKTDHGLSKAFTHAFNVERIKNWAIAAGKWLVNFGKEAINAASDLQEVQNVVDTTFGANATQIESWAKTAKTQFGLTEVQAKRYTSTLGAMAKSSGLASKDIVEMSTDLAGLAADMASFYNLDFDTAFQKIRSGISGETEPLKQLGINMSVANLEAYALTQGITKAFNEMSQGEQIMLRYQYMMQATADAQGDFARTSDGYANSVRLLQTNVESLKGTLGENLIGPMQETVGFLNELVATIFPPEGKKTFLDQLKDVDLKKETRLQEIATIKAAADELSGVLDDLAAPSNVGADLKAIALGANELKIGTPLIWEKLLTSLTGIDGLENIFSNNTTGVDNISALAAALSGASLDKTQAEAWQEFLGALSGNANALTALTGTSVEETKAWLDEMASAANALDPSAADAWDKLLAKLLVGLPGLADTDEGQEFLKELALNFLSMGSESDEATKGLRALGYSTDEIEQKQAAWLATCRELVKTIPGLSTIIDTNTGEVKGGIPAIKEYADEWERTAKYQAEIAAIGEKKSLYESMTDPATLQANKTSAWAQARAVLKVSGYEPESVDEALSLVDDAIQHLVEHGISWEQALDLYLDPNWWQKEATAGIKATENFLDYDRLLYDLEWVQSLGKEQQAAVFDYAEALHEMYRIERERPLVLESFAEQDQQIADEYGVTAEAIDAENEAMEESIETMSQLERAANGDQDALDDVAWAVNNLQIALENLDKYQTQVYEDVDKSVRQLINGFGEIKTPAEQTREKMNELTKQIESTTDATERLNLENQKAGMEGTLPSLQNMTLGLKDQTAYMEEYTRLMEVAKSKGVDAGLLATLSDGSEASYDYLKAIADGTKDEVEALNEAYREREAKRKEFTEGLTNERLRADEEYQKLVENAKNAVADLNLEEEAYQAMGATVLGIENALGEGASVIDSQVTSILASIARLTSVNYGISSLMPGWHVTSFGYVTPHADGLNYVPYDGYLASLHEGESILTAQEAKVWRNFKNGQQDTRNSIDYGRLSSAIWDNAPSMGGGNVYLDGQTVGRVISAQQADSYRNLQRSGWQA